MYWEGSEKYFDELKENESYSLKVNVPRNRYLLGRTGEDFLSFSICENCQPKAQKGRVAISTVQIVQRRRNKVTSSETYM